MPVGWVAHPVADCPTRWHLPSALGSAQGGDGLVREIAFETLTEVTLLCERRHSAPYGAPIHIGDPLALGISDLMHPDWGDAMPVEEGEVPVFWACGVTPQAVIMEAKPEIAITHSPGYQWHKESETARIQRSCSCSSVLE